MIAKQMKLFESRIPVEHQLMEQRFEIRRLNEQIKAQAAELSLQQQQTYRAEALAGEFQAQYLRAHDAENASAYRAKLAENQQR